MFVILRYLNYKEINRNQLNFFDKFDKRYTRTGYLRSFQYLVIDVCCHERIKLIVQVLKCLEIDYKLYQIICLTVIKNANKLKKMLSTSEPT